jgi:ribonucleoside-diphosphate reductase alpha chain
MGPELEFSEAIHSEKYRSKGESFKEAMNRIAAALTDNPDHFKAFRDILLDMRFMPGGRIQGAIGSTKGHSVTAYNCFVSGRIQDSFVEGHGSIMAMATEAATTMRMGGGIGYDFSTLRPRGATIKKLQSHSSGPVSFMQIYDAICRCIASSGHRRGAQMGVMRVDHPDIEEFIHAKQPPKAALPIMDALAEAVPGTTAWRQWFTALQAVYQLTGFNISIAVTDEFMEAVKNDKPFTLRFGGRAYREIDATALWEMIMRSAWDWAEPGIIFIDTVNRNNNLFYCEQIIATNPCGEQPLPAYGACLLGSFNLPRYIWGYEHGKAQFDMDQFKADIPHVVRAMDNVTDLASFPLYEQEQMAKSTRRMGLGVTGLANAVEATGYEYGSGGFTMCEEEILGTLANEAYRASALLAKEKGIFSKYNSAMYWKAPFIQGLDDDVTELIEVNGIRNSHLISIAPTGTISLCADNVSSGIEPVFAYKQRRLVKMPEGDVEMEYEDYGARVFKCFGKRCADVTIDEHLAVLIAASRNVDSAVSKTCNVPATTPWADFKDLYMKAWQAGCKGLATFQVGGKRAGIIKSVDDESSCRIDSETGRRECE